MALAGYLYSSTNRSSMNAAVFPLGLCSQIDKLSPDIATGTSIAEYPRTEPNVPDF